jgi:hypothetical protein
MTCTTLTRIAFTVAPTGTGTDTGGDTDTGTCLAECIHSGGDPVMECPAECGVLGLNPAIGALLMCEFGGMGGNGPCEMDCMP